MEQQINEQALEVDFEKIAGEELDYLVAIAIGKTPTPLILHKGEPNEMRIWQVGGESFMPSDDWNVGGPIMERYNITPWRRKDWSDPKTICMAMWADYDERPGDKAGTRPCTSGSTYLEAAMRLLVKIKLTPEQIVAALNTIRGK
jgi:hypothetical protein